MIAPGNEWLAEQASHGDAEAFGDLAERYQPMLTAYVRSCVSNWADTQDVVQNTLLDAFLGMPRFDKDRPFEPWLRAVCRNRVRKFYRDVASKRAACLSLTDRSVAGETERFIAEENGSGSGSAVLDRLLECMEEMSAHFRRLLELRYIEDLPVKAVAAISGRSCGSVSQTLLRARQTLRTSVERRLRRTGTGTGRATGRSIWRGRIRRTRRRRLRSGVGGGGRNGVMRLLPGGVGTVGIPQDCGIPRRRVVG